MDPSTIECGRVYLKMVRLINKSSFSSEWQKWSLWSACAGSCGSGTQERTRVCINTITGGISTDCQGPRIEVKPCKLRPCIKKGKVKFHKGEGLTTPWGLANVSVSEKTCLIVFIA